MKTSALSHPCSRACTALALLLAVSMHAQSGGVTIGGDEAPHASAVLELRAEDRGLLVPRVALQSATVPVATPAESLLVWNTSTEGAYPQAGFHFWDGGDWKRLLLEDGEAAVKTLSLDGERLEATAAEINALVGIEGLVQARLAALEANAGSVTVNLGTVESTLADFEVRIAANTASSATNASELSGQQTELAALRGDVTTLGSELVANDQDIAVLQADIASAQSAVSATQADVDGFADGLKSLTESEIQQLANIGEVTLSSAQWATVGSLDQGLGTGDAVTFTSVTATTVELEGSTADDFETAVVAIDPTADRILLLPDADGTIALLSDLTSGDSGLQVQVDANASAITTLTTATATNASGISANTVQIDANASAITTLTTETATNAGSLAALTARSISAGTGLTGGGDLSADRTLAIANGGVGTMQLADNAATDAKVADNLTLSGGSIDATPVGTSSPASVRATDLEATNSLTLPDESAAATPNVGMVRYNSAGFLEFYHEISPGVHAWVPVNSYAP